MLSTYNACACILQHIQLLFFLSVTLAMLAGCNSQEVSVFSKVRWGVSEMKRGWEPTVYWWSFSLEDGRDCPIELCRDRLRRRWRRNKINAPAASKQRTAADPRPIRRPYHHLNPPPPFFDWLAGTPAQWNLQHMLERLQSVKEMWFSNKLCTTLLFVGKSKWRLAPQIQIQELCHSWNEI